MIIIDGEQAGDFGKRLLVHEMRWLAIASIDQRSTTGICFYCHRHAEQDLLEKYLSLASPEYISKDDTKDCFKIFTTGFWLRPAKKTREDESHDAFIRLSYLLLSEAPCVISSDHMQLLRLVIPKSFLAGKTCE